MNPHTQKVCAALVLTFIGGIVYAQSAPDAAPAQTKPAQTTPATTEGQSKPTAAAPTAAAPTPAAQPAAAPTSAAVPPAPVVPGNVVTPPPGYLIGPEDVLGIVYWKDKDMTSEVQVRPDGKISLSLLNEVTAAGLTPDQLRERLVEESKKYMEDANITVVVKQINSRKVFITGQVTKQGPYPLIGPTTVMQLISLAGGLAEFADSKNIMVIRTENGRQVAHKVNYKDVMAGKKLAQNIELKPGDTILVP